MMKPYFFSIKVVLKKPLKATLQSGEHHGFLGGYYRNIGVRAENLSCALEILETVAEDGEIDREATLVHDFSKLEREISKRFSERDNESIWYAAGRIYFPLSGDSN